MESGEYSEGWQDAALLLLYVYTPVFIITLGLFLYRGVRGIQPIRHRSPWLVAVSSLGGYLFVVQGLMLIYLGEDGYPCLMRLYISNVALSVLVVPYFVRCWRLHYLLLFQQRLLSEQLTGDTEHDAQFERIRKRITTSLTQPAEIVRERSNSVVSAVSGSRRPSKPAIDSDFPGSASPSSPTPGRRRPSDRTQRVVALQADSREETSSVSRKDSASEVNSVAGSDKPRANSLPADSLRSMTSVRSLTSTSLLDGAQSPPLSPEVSRRSGLDASPLSSQLWYQKARRYLSPRFSLVVMITVFGLRLLVPVIENLAITVYREDPGATGCPTNEQPLSIVFLLNSAEAIVYYLLLALFFFRVRQLRDGFNISRELRGCLMLWFVGLLVWLAVNMDREAFRDMEDRGLPPSMVLVTVMVMTFALSVLLPLFASFSPKGRFELAYFGQREDDFATSIENVLSDPVAREYFREFLIEVFAVENILFYEDCEAYRRLARLEDRKRHARQICHKFVDPKTADFEINIAGGDRQKVMIAVTNLQDDKGLGDSQLEVFAPAEVAVLNQMQAECISRFVGSPLYRQMSKELNLGNQLSTLLEENKMV